MWFYYCKRGYYYVCSFLWCDDIMLYIYIQCTLGNCCMNEWASERVGVKTEGGKGYRVNQGSDYDQGQWTFNVWEKK